MTLDLDLFRATPLVREPFEYLVVPGFVRHEACEGVNADYPEISKPGSFPVDEVTFGPRFAELLADLDSDAMRTAFEEKFGIDLHGKPTMTTVRGRCSERDGRIHTDSDTKIITVLIYLNSKWEQPGGQLRLLRSAADLEDMIMEVPPLEGTLLAFKRSTNSFHGHKQFVGPRRVVQFNWVTSQNVVDRAMARHRFAIWTKKIRSMFSSKAS
jgi:hypothetical protein